MQDQCVRCWIVRDVEERLWGHSGVCGLKEMAACPQAAGKAEHKWKTTADDNTVSNAKIIHVRLLPVKPTRQVLLCPVELRNHHWSNDMFFHSSDQSWKLSHNTPKIKLHKNSEKYFQSFQWLTLLKSEKQQYFNPLCPQRHLIKLLFNSSPIPK